MRHKSGQRNPGTKLEWSQRLFRAVQRVPVALAARSLALAALSLALAVLGVAACTTPPKPKAAHAKSTQAEAAEPVAGPTEGLTIRPRDAAPPALDAKEKKTLASKCAALEEALYEAGKVAVQRLEAELASGEKKAEQNAVAAGIARVGQPQGGMGAAEHDTCVKLFRKQLLHRVFEHEPAEKEARAFVAACVRRVDASFGKASMAYEMGGSGAQQVGHGPFCPDDLPIPPLLKDLPYKSTKDDWDAPAWRCLTFGMRTRQNVQVEYLSQRGSENFSCIARFLSRHGGPPQEIYRSGKLNEEGELLIEKKAHRRDMKVPAGQR